jgi:hypothetical protein
MGCSSHDWCKLLNTESEASLDIIRRILGEDTTMPRQRYQDAASQPHYTVAQIAKVWSISQSTALRIFKEEPGVLRIGNTNSRKRTKISIRIPHDVALRVHSKLTGADHQSAA